MKKSHEQAWYGIKNIFGFRLTWEPILLVPIVQHWASYLTVLLASVYFLIKWVKTHLPYIFACGLQWIKFLTQSKFMINVGLLCLNSIWNKVNLLNRVCFLLNRILNKADAVKYSSRCIDWISSNLFSTSCLLGNMGRI